MKRTKLMLGDNIQSLQKLPDNSIDSIVSDPPYGLSFMGKKWDYDVPSVEFWKEVYRVLKPGGHVLSFGGTRTYHRMVVNIEDAGFEIRDQIMWLYGSGFPKSHNIGKAVDKLQGNDREVLGTRRADNIGGKDGLLKAQWEKVDDVEITITKGQSPYEGWGTALKPANEPICVARKPLSEKSVAENVLRWGTGGINIDGCRVDLNGDNTSRKITDNKNDINVINSNKVGSFDDKWKEGRFPANIILECLCDEIIDGGFVKSGSSNRTDKGIVTGNLGFSRGTEIVRNTKIDIHTNPMCPCYLMDEQSGVSKSTPSIRPVGNYENNSGFGKYKESISTFSDKGGASRFFYQAKVSKQERNMGLDEFEETTTGGKGHGLDRRCSHCNTSMLKPEDCKCENPDWITPAKKNTHPTIKPVSLMSYLVRLVTPPNGIVLDPFMGSGSTGIAAQLEGFRFCGMEMDADYFKIAEARIENYEQYKKFIK
jgi:site-specific DNA-methyltransferase (adenine-specific)